MCPHRQVASTRIGSKSPPSRWENVTSPVSESSNSSVTTPNPTNILAFSRHRGQRGCFVIFILSALFQIPPAMRSGHRSFGELSTGSRATDLVGCKLYFRIFRFQAGHLLMACLACWICLRISLRVIICEPRELKNPFRHQYSTKWLAPIAHSAIMSFVYYIPSPRRKPCLL